MLIRGKRLWVGRIAGGFGAPWAALDCTLNFKGYRIQAAWSLEAARTISRHSCHIDKGLRSKNKGGDKLLCFPCPLLTLTWITGRQTWEPDEKCREAQELPQAEGWGQAKGWTCLAWRCSSGLQAGAGG